VAQIAIFIGVNQMDPTLPPIPAAPQAAAYANPPAGVAAAAAAPQPPAGEYEEIREQVCFIFCIFISDVATTHVYL